VVPNSIKHGLILTTTTPPISQIPTYENPEYVDDVVHRFPAPNKFASSCC
jgi:hypothetical protein